MLKTFLKQLMFNKEVILTLCLLNPEADRPDELWMTQFLSPPQDVSEMVERNRRNEVLLLYLRFFNILMSRKKIKHEEGKVHN